MMKIKVLKTDGSDSGKNVTLNEQIFNIDVNDTLVYEDVRSYLSNQRQGTAKTKGRSQVRGGGRKAYRQKGTGNARRGTIRSPLLKGGGTVFGPKPRTYSVRLTKKMKSLARKSALTYKAHEGAILVIEDFSFEAPKTKELIRLVKALNVSDKKVLFYTAASEYEVYLSSRNIANVDVLEVEKVNTYEILNADVLVLTESALNNLDVYFSTIVEA